MSNCSGGGPKVPFGDGNHVPIEDIDQHSHRTEIFVQSALNEIFVSCDKEKTNSVLVSDLINVIQPFFSQNELELLELKRALDPNNINPCIDCETFLGVMNVWISRLSGECLNDNNIINCEISELPFAQSSPNNILSKESVESNFLNVSCTFTELNNTETMDSVFYQDQVKELEHQNRKLQEELKHVNNQLASYEEQVDTLQVEYDKALKKEQQLTEQLHRNENENHEILETSSTTSKQICKLEKKLASSEKHVLSLQETIEELQDQNKTLQNSNEQILQREIDAKKEIENLIQEINNKEHAIMSFEEVTTQLKIEIDDQKRCIEHYQSSLESLKLEKKNVEKKFQDHLLSHESVISLNKSQGISPNLNTSSFFFKNSFNTPELLSRLTNKVTSFNSSVASTKKSVDSVDSPVFFNNKRIADLAKSDKCSTPVGTLIDSTPPSAVRKIPILNPHLQNGSSSKEAKLKKLTLFDNYRFTGNSSDDEDDNKQPPSKNLHHLKNNLITQIPEIANSLPIYTVERTDEEASPETIGMGSFDLSDDEVFLNFQHTNCSARNSLDSELVEANSAFLKEDLEKLRHENDEYKEIIQQLKVEIDELKISETKLKNSTQKYNLEGFVKYDSNVQDKMEKLESDNNLKYIKIVDLMEEKESLQIELKNLRLMYNNEIKNTTSNLSVEKKNLEQQFGKQFHEKQQLSDTLTHIKNSEHDHKVANQRSKIVTDSEEKLLKECQELKTTNSELKQKMETLNQSICKLNTENTNFKNKIKKLLDETKKLKSEILLGKKEQEQLQTQYEKLNCNLKQAREKNNELKDKFEKSNREVHFLTSNYKDLLKSKELETKQLCDLKKKEAEHLTQVKICKELKDSNTTLSKSLLEKKNQITTLKDMVELQKTKIKSLEAEKNNILSKLEINDKERECLAQENKNWQKQLKDAKNECEKLRQEMTLLEELNNNNQDTIKTLVDDNNNVYKECDLLKEEQKLILERKNEEIVKVQSKFTNLEQKHKVLIGQYDLVITTRDNLSQEIVQVQSKFTDLEEKYKVLISEYDLAITTRDNLIKEISQKNLITDSLNNSNQNRISCLENANIKLKSELDALRNRETKIHKTDFLPERSYSDENLQCGHSFCTKCRNLEMEIQNANVRVQQLDQKLSCLEAEKQTSTKSHSYTKMQIKIEKLEKKLEKGDYMSKLRQKSMSELELSRVKLIEDLETNLKLQKKENLKLEQTRSTLEEKTQTLLQDIKNLEMKNRENSKQHVTEKNKLVSRKTALVGDIQKLQEDCCKLQAQLSEVNTEKDLIIQENLSLKQNFKLFTDLKDNSLEMTKIENCKLKNQAEQMLNQNLELEKQIQNLKQSNETECDKVKSLNSTINMHVAIIDQLKIDNMRSKVEMEDTNRKLNSENVLLQEKTTDLNSLVKKTEQEIIKWKNLFCKNGDEQENLLTTTEDSNILIEEELKTNNLQKQLFNCEKELNEVNLKLYASTKDLNTLTEHMKHVEEELGEKRHRLSRSLLTAIGAWRFKLENKLEYKIIMEEFSKSADCQSHYIYLDEEMVKMKHQVHITSLFLELMVCSFLSAVLELILRHTKGSVIAANQNVEVQVSFPVPILDKCLKNTTFKDSSTSTSEVTRDREINFDKGSSHNSSPDSGGLHQINQSGRDSDSKDSQKIISTTSKEIVETDQNEKKQVLFDVASPSCSYDVLDDLEPTEECQSTERTLKELEEQFSVLTLTFVTPEKKYQLPQNCQNEIEQKYLRETENLLINLTAIKQLNVNQQIDKLVTTCLNQVEEHKTLYPQVLELVTRNGALQQEEKFTNSMSVMVNYVEKLKQVLGSESHQLKYTNTSLTLNHKKFGNFVVSKTENEVSTGDSFSEVVETRNRSSLLISPTSNGIKFKRWFKSIGRSGVFHEFCWFWALLFLTISLIILGNTIIDLEHMRFNVPLPNYSPNSFTWSEFFASYFRLHHNAPPPI